MKTDTSGKPKLDAAGRWLADYLAGHGGNAPSAAVKDAACGVSESTLHRARRGLGIDIERVRDGDSRRFVWRLPTTTEPDATEQAERAAYFAITAAGTIRPPTRTRRR